MYGIEVDGVAALEFAFAAKTAALGPGVAKVVTFSAQRLQMRILANATARPGPRAPTGDYRRSWNTILRGGALSFEADVGTNAPQGMRLEYGFTGRDAIGRVYDQPPYPHVAPALAVTGPEFIRGMERVQAEVAE